MQTPKFEYWFPVEEVYRGIPVTRYICPNIVENPTHIVIRRKKLSCILEPLGERVIMNRDRPQQKGNVIIPEQFRNKHAASRGECVAIGPDVEQVEVGKTYIWGQHAGAWVTADGYPTTEENDAQFYALNEGDIIAGLNNG